MKAKSAIALLEKSLEYSWQKSPKKSLNTSAIMPSKASPAVLVLLTVSIERKSA